MVAAGGARGRVDMNGMDSAQREALALQGVALNVSRMQRTRFNVDNFIESVFLDEQGEPLHQAPFHRRIQRNLGDEEDVIVYAPPEHGKTVQVGLRILWEIGNRPGLRVLIVTSTSSQAKKVLGALKNNIERNERLWQVFPSLTKANFPIWRDNLIQFGGFHGTRKDYTVQAVGIGGAILGARVDIAILDDVVTLENASTPGQRQKLIDWYESTLLTRITVGGRVWIIGTPWHRYDLMHTLEDRGTPALRLPVEQDGRFLWPAKWNRARLQRRKQRMTSWRYYQQYYCQDVAPDLSPFTHDALRRCYVSADAFRNPGAAPDRFQFITGVDLAVSKKKGSDYTAFVTIATDGQNKMLLDIRRGRWNLMEIKSVAEALHRTYGGVFVVENVAAQDYLAQLLKAEARMPVMTCTTTRKTKIDERFGVPALAIDIENGRWQIPGVPDSPLEVRELIDEMTMYNPQAHAGDTLMACYFAYSGVSRMYRMAEVRVHGAGGD